MKIDNNEMTAATAVLRTHQLPTQDIARSNRVWELRFHSLTRSGSTTASLYGEVGHPAQSECQPAQDTAEYTDAQDTGFDNCESEVTSDGFEVFDIVPFGDKDGEDNPSDEGDDEPVAGWVVSKMSH